MMMGRTRLALPLRIAGSARLMSQNTKHAIKMMMNNLRIIQGHRGGLFQVQAPF